MPSVTLVAGPAATDVINVGDPWPREYLRVFADGNFETYLLRTTGPPYYADWIDSDAVEPPPEELEGTGAAAGPPGPAGETGAPGPQGEPGKPITHRGEWDVATTYDYNDAVSYEGSGYLSKSGLNLGHEPTLPASGPNWGLIAEKGDPGPTGAEGPVGPEGPEGDLGPAGSPLPAREEVEFTTASLAANAAESGVVEIAKGFRILRLETSRAAWVRFYTTADKRTADAARPIDSDPAGDHGLTFEGITSASLLGFDTSPVPQSYSMEATPSDDIAYRVTNLGAAGAVTVTLTIQRQEA